MNTLDRPPPTHKPTAAAERGVGVVTKKPGRFRWIWFVAIIGVVVAAIVFFSQNATRSTERAGRRFGPGGAGQPTPVASIAAEKGDLPIYLNALGTVTAFNTVTVRSRADGELLKIHFSEGQRVKAGDLLAEIDPRSYQVALEQAEGQLARDKALLENARRDYERYQNAQAAVTQQQIDTAKSTVAQYVGAIQADQGAVDNDKLQLSYCRVTAPISGIVGLRLIDQGNLVHASDATGIAVITQDDPIAMVFNIPEDNLPQVREALAGGQKLAVEAYDRAMEKRLAVGEVLALDNQIDTNTGTVRIKALFANTDHELYPNQFVNVRMLVEILRGVVLIPNSAIQINSQSRFVFVVKPDGTVERRTIKVSRSEGDKSAISDGLALGEIVVTDGLDRLQDGSRVTTRTPVVVGGKDSGASGADGQPGARSGHGHRIRGAGTKSGS